jgi:Secretion system C-terminal sorting domain
MVVNLKGGALTFSAKSATLQSVLPEQVRLLLSTRVHNVHYSNLWNLLRRSRGCFISEVPMGFNLVRFSSALVLLIILSSSLHHARAQYQNVRVSPPSANDPEEVSIAISPVDQSYLAAGANINYYYYSTNGGLNWTQGRLSSTYGVWGDPCVLYDKLGNLYFGHLSNPPSPGYWIDRIVVQRSTDWGESWNSGVGIGYNPPNRNQDKEWLATDMTRSQFRNRVYIAWTQFDSYNSSNPADSSRILFSHSTDYGLTWSIPVRVSDRAGDCLDEDNTVEGAVPAVAPNGDVYLAWAGPLGLMFDKSTDGGETWGNDTFISSQPGGWDYAVTGIYRCNGLPITACDISNSPYRGTVYVNWTDQRNGLSNPDVFISKSTDGGVTWSQAKQVNDDLTTSPQFFSWMTVDPLTGYLYIVFYDRRGTQGTATDVYVARSTDGGDTFSNFKVSQSSFTPTSGVFFGDYTNIAAYNGKVYPIWMRLDGSALSVWIAIINDTLSTGVVAPEGYARSFSLMQNFPNPFNPSTMIRYDTAKREHVTIGVFDVLGREVATLVDRVVDPGEHTVTFSAWEYHLSSGTYFYRMTAGSYSQTRKFILLE